MKHDLLLAAFACALGAGPLAAAPADERAAARSVAAFVDAVNKGDSKAALARLTTDAAITDDLAPYRWQGPHAGADWFGAMGRNAQRLGVTRILMNLAAPMRVEASGDSAYEVVRGSLVLEGKGPPLHANGVLTFALRRSGGVWRICLLSWAGERPHR
jgi:ketosteroid isomerase-like protein